MKLEALILDPDERPTVESGHLPHFPSEFRIDEQKLSCKKAVSIEVKPMSNNLCSSLKPLNHWTFEINSVIQHGRELRILDP